MPAYTPCDRDFSEAARVIVYLPTGKLAFCQHHMNEYADALSAYPQIALSPDDVTMDAGLAMDLKDGDIPEDSDLIHAIEELYESDGVTVITINPEDIQPPKSNFDGS